MRTTTLGAGILAATLATTLLTGCGSKDDATTTTAPSTTSVATESSAAPTSTATESSTTEATTSTSATDTSTATPASATATDSTTATAAAAGTVNITTMFGPAEFPVAPKKVVAIGQASVDNLLSLGIKPTAIVGSARDKNIPWQTERGVGDVPFIEVASFMQLKPEMIASYKPDLIVADVWSVGTRDKYAKLSAIAPTLTAASPDPKGISWRTQLTNLGKIYNAGDKVQSIIAADKALFAQAAASMPGLKGKKAIASQYIGQVNAFGVIAQPTLPANEFFTDLGMTIPQAIVNAPDQDAGRATISAENISMLNADFAVFGPRGASTADMEAVPGFKELSQVKSGAYFVAEKQYQLQAINQPSALSRAYILKVLTPKLKVAAGS